MDEVKAQAAVFTESCDPNVRHLGHLLNLAVMASEVRDLHLPDLLAQLEQGYALYRAEGQWVVGRMDSRLHCLSLFHGNTPEQALVALIASRKDTT